jgi:hypothetical protein
MDKRLFSVYAGLCGLIALTLCAVPSGAQMTEVKEKPPMYSYVANWQIPRAHWEDMEKSASARNAILEKALADGTIVGYGDDMNLVHQPEAETHDNWWSAMSMAGLIKVLDRFFAADISSSPNAASPTKHWDNIYVSRYYNWHSGSWKGGYGYIAMYKLKADAPDNALDLLSRTLFAPLMEKMLADGTILEYEVDTQAIHTEAPGTFAIIFVAPKPEGVDTVLSAIRGVQREHPLHGQAFGSMVDISAHRDELMKGNGTYK